MNQPYKKLALAARQNIRIAAQKVSKFATTGNGAIRFRFFPYCEEADLWLGGLSTFSKANLFDGDIVGCDDIADYELTFQILPSGSRVIDYVEDGEKRPVNCYAFSAMKIAHCEYTSSIKTNLLSGTDVTNKKLTEEYGFGPYRGALCVKVLKDKICWCDIYVCVSGADSDDDLKCALEAVPAIKDFFAEEDEAFEIVAPNDSKTS